MVRNMDNYKKLCIELVLSTCLVVSTLAMSTTNFTTDQLALLSLKQHITSDPGGSILGNNWSTAVSVCEWIGVTCSPRHPGRVTQVNISNMGLAGTIPADIGNLSFLVSLDMRNNNFHGVPPERMVNLRRLRYIDLRFNNFVGEVPSWFGFLDKLQSLLLSKNQFSGVIPKQIGNLYKLEHLRMPYNNLEGGIPKEICNLTMLKSLVLCSNHLTEYGSEGLVSTRCDVYSYGIVLMEVFTRKKPNDEMFGENLSLKSWILDSLPNAIVQVIDANLIRPDKSSFSQELNCISAIMEVAMKCSRDSPRDRSTMGDVLEELKKIKLLLSALDRED
nr:probable LRR receptor-like serine/threonine-protein kinase At3g47570 isoform X2 [Coffea arabica]